MSDRGGKREGSGRKKGISPITTARAELLQHSDTIISKLLERVNDGCPVALKLALERILPPIKTVPVYIDSLDTEKPLSAQIQAILDTFARGEVSTEETAKLLETITAGNQKLKSAKLDEKYSFD